MAVSFQFKLISLDGCIFNDKIQSLTAPGESGSFGVLGGHSQMVAGLAGGKLTIKQPQKDKETFFLINGGVCEVREDEVVVLCEKAESISHEILVHSLPDSVFTPSQ